MRRSIGSEDVEAGFPLKPGAVLDARIRLQDAVNVLRRSLHFKLNPEWGEVELGLAEVYDVGLGVLDVLFGAKMPEFLKTMKQLLPDVDEQEAGVPCIQVVCDKDAILPFELVPIFRIDQERPPICNDDSLTETIGRFIGHATNVRRHIRGAPVTHLPLVWKGHSWVSCFPNAEGLRVGMFQEISLKEAAAEMLEMERHGSRLILLGPWPSGRVSSIEEIVAEILCERVPPGEFRAHVLHFSCHCDSDVVSPSNVTIRLRGEQTPRIDVRLMNLHARSVFLRASRAIGGTLPAANLPLIFLNACSSAATEVFTGASLPEFFQSQGYAGFIGTETAVPDTVAAAFSKEFYDRFLEGCSLSDSLRRSRQALLLEHKNPLGLVYVAYADGDIYVEYPTGRRPPE
ncbi:CHAT domain-containing protein [Streptomyces bobili]|uniref:CHAT domain-containing protein n=1 Tax=Streptomyces bobili TaxID=67280 RepID=UPI0036EFDD78